MIERLEIDTELGDGRVVARGDDCMPVPATGEWCRAADVAELEAELEHVLRFAALWKRLAKKQFKSIQWTCGWVKEKMPQIEFYTSTLGVIFERAEAAEALWESEANAHQKTKARAEAAESELEFYKSKSHHNGASAVTAIAQAGEYFKRAEAAEAELQEMCKAVDYMYEPSVNIGSMCLEKRYLESIAERARAILKDVGEL